MRFQRSCEGLLRFVETPRRKEILRGSGKRMEHWGLRAPLELGTFPAEQKGYGSPASRIAARIFGFFHLRHVTRGPLAGLWAPISVSIAGQVSLVDGLFHRIWERRPMRQLDSRFGKDGVRFQVRHLS